MPAEKLVDGPKWIIEQALIKLSARNPADSGDGRETDDFVVILKMH